jgi:SAM-dependent methyltransferase
MDKKNRTIKDFGNQWLRYPDNDGFYGSLELFSDILHPFIKIEEINGRQVAEIGSGTGRVVNMLLEAGAMNVIAVEPSKAFEVLTRNILQPEKVTCLRITGDQLPAYGDLDFIFSIGVLHHIPDPGPVVKAAYKALRPGGLFFAWLYGKEGNRLFLSFVYPLRHITKHLPDALLTGLVWIIYCGLVVYIHLCQRMRLPLREYVLSVLEKMAPKKRRLVIYDQLNPAYAKYYTKNEAERLLADGGFMNIQLHHRHGYS